MQSKLNFFHGFCNQADSLRPSGSDDTYVMKQALKDYQKRYQGGFPHVEAWEVVRKHEKWIPVPLFGEDSSSSGQKRKSSDSGNYQASTPNTEFTSGIPDININPSPRRQKKKEKKDKGPASTTER